MKAKHRFCTAFMFLLYILPESCHNKGCVLS